MVQFVSYEENECCEYGPRSSQLYNDGGAIFGSQMNKWCKSSEAAAVIQFCGCHIFALLMLLEITSNIMD